MANVRLLRLVVAAGIALLASSAAHAVAVRLIANLTSITFYERTGGVAPTPYTFAVNSAQLSTRLADPLGAGNHDIPGAATEYYDVFYSDADGTFNPNGEYLTIEGVFLLGLPDGGGLNLAEIALNFSGGAPPEFGSFVASFVALGDNAIPGDVGLAIDGNLQTHTDGQHHRLVAAPACDAGVPVGLRHRRKYLRRHPDAGGLGADGTGGPRRGVGVAGVPPAPRRLGA